MEIGRLRDKIKLLALFKEYEPLRANLVRNLPSSQDYLDDLVTRYLIENKVILDLNGFVVFSKDRFNIGHIEHLYVSENSRRKGIGKLLISNAETQLFVTKKIILLNSIYNRPVNDFYKSLGYKLLGESKDYYHFEKNLD